MQNGRTIKYYGSYPRSGIRVMFELAKKYPDAIALTLGQPNFDTPQFIKDAAIESLQGGLTGYVSNGGLPELQPQLQSNTRSALVDPLPRTTS